MAEPITYPNLTLELLDTATLIQEAMVDKLFDNNSVITGNLARSLTVVEQNDDTIVIIDNSGKNTAEGYDYGESVNYGWERRAGGFPPVQAITEWIKLKRIRPKDPNMSTKTLAFLIARSIAEKGQQFRKPKPFIEPAVNQVFEQKLRNDNYGEAVALDIDENIQTNYGEIG